MGLSGNGRPKKKFDKAEEAKKSQVKANLAVTERHKNQIRLASRVRTGADDRRFDDNACLVNTAYVHKSSDILTGIHVRTYGAVMFLFDYNLIINSIITIREQQSLSLRKL